MPQIEILSERKLNSGWIFDVRVLDQQSKAHQHRLTLSWADYNLWSPDGGDAPVRVAEAVVHFVLARNGDELTERFDASMARRKFPDADEAIPALIQR